MKPTKNFVGTPCYALATRNMTNLHHLVHAEAGFEDYMKDDEFPD
jgi:hypothetical protein